jgi:hypothetical protein
MHHVGQGASENVHPPGVQALTVIAVRRAAGQAWRATDPGEQEGGDMASEVLDKALSMSTLPKNG